MSIVLALSLLIGSATAAAPNVVVANGDWSYLPLLEHRGYDHLSSTAMQRMYEITKERQCQLPGQSYGKLDLRISFAAQFEPDGTLTNLILPKLNCAEAEGILAGAILDMMRGGDYRPTGSNDEGWYRGTIAFGYDG